MTGVSAVVCSAIGYSRRRKGDSLRSDNEHRNVVDAARSTGVPRFVFLSILACYQAPNVPQCWRTKLTEDHLAAQGVPFISLRPGASLGAPADPRYRQWMVGGLQKGRVLAMTGENVRMSYIDPAEVARALAMAVDEPRAVGQKIDLGSDRPLSGPELAQLLGELLGRPMRPRTFSGGLGKLLGVFMPGMRDMMSMVDFFQTGKYVAHTERQAELFGPIPKVEEAARHMIQDLGLHPAPLPP